VGKLRSWEVEKVEKIEAKKSRKTEGGRVRS